MKHAKKISRKKLKTDRQCYLKSDKIILQVASRVAVRFGLNPRKGEAMFLLSVIELILTVALVYLAYKEYKRNEK